MTRMSDKRPKLLIVEGPNVSADDLAERLGAVYELVESQDDGPADGPVEAVLVDADKFPLLAAELARERAITLLNAIGEGVCLSDAGGTALWGNDFFRSLPASLRERISGAVRESAQLFAEQRASSDGAADASSLQDSTCKFEFSTEDGQRFFEVYVTPAPEKPDADGHMDAGRAEVAAVIRDVTASRRIRTKMNAIDAAGCELVNFEAEEVRRLNAVERLRYLQQKITRYNKDLLNFDHFAIFLTDLTTSKLELVISEGLPKEIEDLDLYIEREGSGISGFVALTGESYIARDVSADERFLPGLAGAQSSLTVPLKLNDRVIGIMDVESGRPGAFTEEDRQFAEIFGRHIAIALHMLDLLVAERSTTNESVSGRVQGELDEPLEDIVHEADWLLDETKARDPKVAEHIAKIKQDVESIRRRVKDVAEGPHTLLGVERAMHDRTKDPLLVGRRVLVADDALKIRRIIGDVLRNRGCEVTVCENGGEAIAYIDEVAGGSRSAFEVVISDIKMPDRNGYEVFASSRKSMPGVPVILMTGFGYDPHHSIVRASQEGLQSVLFKPFQIEQLIDQVRQVFDPELAERS